MRLLVDTQYLIWLAATPERISQNLRNQLIDFNNSVHFSVISIWEVAIKNAKGNPDFDVDPVALRKNLLDNGWAELEFTGADVIIVNSLPPVHKDPFDRALVAQARQNGLELITSDETLQNYGDWVRQVSPLKR